MSARVEGASEESVRKATGRGWDEWLAAIDAAGGRDWGHGAIAEWVVENHPAVSGWWSQTITVGYERARGKRVVHQKADGEFEVSVSKTIAADSADVWKAWADGRRRRAWLPDAPIRVTTASEGRYARAAWDDSERIVFSLEPTPAGKTRATVQHGKLPDAGAAARAKAFWKERLDALRSAVEA